MSPAPRYPWPRRLVRTSPVAVVAYDCDHARASDALTAPGVRWCPDCGALLLDVEHLDLAASPPDRCAVLVRDDGREWAVCPSRDGSPL